MATWTAVPRRRGFWSRKKQGRFTEARTRALAMDVVGWDGFVYPWRSPSRNYQPKTGLIHLPPTIHATFAGHGFWCLVRSATRGTTTARDSLPVPALQRRLRRNHPLRAWQLHQSKGVGPGAISLHPSGVAHGPHPAPTKEASARRDRRACGDLDVYEPLAATTFALGIEHAAVPRFGENTVTTVRGAVLGFFALGRCGVFERSWEPQRRARA